MTWKILIVHRRERSAPCLVWTAPLATLLPRHKELAMSSMFVPEPVISRRRAKDSASTG